MTDTLRIIPLGGLGEVGKNMTLYEFDGQRILIDAGLAFPRDEHLGVDLVLPDFSYLEDRPLLAIVLTHGHEDHVGALPYVLREIEAREVVGTQAHARDGEVEARRARARRLDDAARGRPGRRRDADRPVQARVRAHGAFDPRLRRDRRRDAPPGASSTRATGSSTTRRSTGSRPMSASSPRSATAASISCSATRRTQSDPG